MSKKATADKVPLRSKAAAAEDESDEQEMGAINAPDPVPRPSKEEDDTGDEDDDMSAEDGDDGEDDESDMSENTSAVRNRRAPLSSLIPAKPLHVLNLGAFVSFLLLCAVVVVSLSTLGTQVISRRQSAGLVLRQHTYVGALQRLDFAVATIYEYLLFGDSLLLAQGVTDHSASTVVVNKKAISLSDSAKHVLSIAQGALADAAALAQLAQEDTIGSSVVANKIGANFSSLLTAVINEIENVVIPFTSLTYQQRSAFHAAQKSNRQLITSNLNNIEVATALTKGMTILRKVAASCSSFPACNSSGANELLANMSDTYMDVVSTLEDSTSQFLEWIDSPHVSPSLDVSSGVAYITPLVVAQAANCREHAYLTLKAQASVQQLIAARSTSETLGNASAAVQALSFVSTPSDLTSLSTIAGLIYTALMAVRQNVKNWLSGVQVAWINLGVARRYDFSTPFFPPSHSDTDTAGGLKYINSPLVDSVGLFTYNATQLAAITGNTSKVAAFAKIARAGYLAAITAEQTNTDLLASNSDGVDPVADAATWKIQVVLAICIVLPALAVLYVLYGVSLRLASSPFPYSYFVLGLLFCYGLHLAVCISCGMIATSAVQVPTVLTREFAVDTAIKTNLVLQGFDAANVLLSSALLVAPLPMQLNASIAAAIVQVQGLDASAAPWAPAAISALRDEQRFSIFARRDAISSDGTYSLRMASLKFTNVTLCADVLSTVLKQLTLETMFNSWRRDELMLLRQTFEPTRARSAIDEAQAYRLDLCTQCGSLFPTEYCGDSLPLLFSPGQDVLYRVFGPAGLEGQSVQNWRSVFQAVTDQTTVNTLAVTTAFDNEQLLFTQKRRLIVWLGVFGIMLIQALLYVISLRTFGPSTSSMLP